MPVGGRHGRYRRRSIQEQEIGDDAAPTRTNTSAAPDERGVNTSETKTSELTETVHCGHCGESYRPEPRRIDEERCVTSVLACQWCRVYTA
jgi:hypothetical protein